LRNLLSQVIVLDLIEKVFCCFGKLNELAAYICCFVFFFFRLYFSQQPNSSAQIVFAIRVICVVTWKFQGQEYGSCTEVRSVFRKDHYLWKDI
jgi:hypothetical protein